MPSNQFKLYVLKDADYDAVIAKYRQICEQGITYIEGDVTLNGVDDLKVVYKKEPRKPLRDNYRIRNKALFLMHSIIYRQETSHENNEAGSPLQASILQAVLKQDFYEILKAFIELGYVEMSSVYVIGKTSRRYKVLGEVGTEPCSNIAIQKYITHTKELLAEKIEKRIAAPSFINLYGEGFADTYIKNLNKFKIQDKNGFEIFVANRIKNSPDTEAYYDFVKESFNDKLKIYRIDDNDRIYHILTSLKRELKQYLNIRFSIDCSNSHPLLFNYFIIINKNISISNSNLICNILSNISKENLSISSNIHYDIQKLRNILNYNGVENSICDKFLDDELLYLWKTTIGTFWDDILTEHQDEEIDRAELKKKMFGEVFYSKTPKKWWKRFATEFSIKYPNVYELIEKWKTPRRYPELSEILLRHNKAFLSDGRIIIADEDTALPNIMMDLESSIFREILKTLFANHICAVHIHDAIVIPDIKSTEHIDSEIIVSIMRNVYQKYGLHPHFKVETN